MATKQSFHAYPPIQSAALLVVRLAVAGLMLVHGIPKMQKLFAGGEIKFADPIGIGELPSLVLTVFSEVLCSVLVGIGLLTRWATIPLIITMVVAAFIVHAPDPIGDKEMSLLYLLIYLLIAVFGSGRYSVDALRK